jgi:nicotinamide-nucleotide amidase
MKCHIIIIGSELLNGRMIDTNSSYIAEELNKYGIEITGKSIVGDKKEDIISVLKKFYNENDILLLSGGLGPTIDDITRDAVADFLKSDLIFSDIEFNKLKNRFIRMGIEMPERNKRQALFPENSKIISNDKGSAPAFYVDKIAVFPGVPIELENTFNKFIKRFAEENNLNSNIYIKDILVWGLPESELEKRILDIVEKEEEVFVEFLVKDFGIIVRLMSDETLKNKSDNIKEKIYERIGEYIFGEDEDRLENLLKKELEKYNYTISLAESCTGGLITSHLVSVSGISQFLKEGLIVYSNEAKVERLNVNMNTIKEFGAVSSETVKEMLEGLKTDTGIAVSGIAGPEGGTVEKPVGTVYIGVKIKDNYEIKKHFFRGDRERIRQRAALTGINELINFIKKVNK